MIEPRRARAVTAAHCLPRACGHPLISDTSYREIAHRLDDSILLERGRAVSGNPAPPRREGPRTRSRERYARHAIPGSPISRPRIAKRSLLHGLEL